MSVRPAGSVPTQRAAFDTRVLDKAIRDRRRRLAAEQAELLQRARRVLLDLRESLGVQSAYVVGSLRFPDLWRESSDVDVAVGGCSALRARCRDIDRIANRIAERRTEFSQGVAAEVDSMGYQLHNLYGAFEQLFEEVARFFENRIDEARYHSDLIRRMQLEIRGIRPALLSEATASDLDELRRFRHLFRHAYAMDLDPAKVAELADGVPGMWSAFMRDFEQFLSVMRPQ